MTDGPTTRDTCCRVHQGGGRLQANCGCEVVKQNAQASTEVVSNPEHYTYGRIECIDAIADAVADLDGLSAYCTGNLIKYVWRFHKKNGLEDLHKARWYLEKLIERQQELNAQSIGPDYEVNR